MNGYNCFLEDHFFIDHQDSEESEGEVEGLTYEELRETEEYTVSSSQSAWNRLQRISL